MSLHTKTPVFFLNNSGGPECLTDAKAAVQELSFLPHYLIDENSWTSESERIVETEIGRVRVPRDWTFAGWAEVTIHLVDRNELIANKVRALEGEADRISAEAQARITEIRRKINSILAIDMAPDSERSAELQAERLAEWRADDRDAMRQEREERDQ